MLKRVWRKEDPPALMLGGKLVQPLWRTVCRFLKKLKLELLYDLAIPLWDRYLERNILLKDTCTPVFFAVLLTIAKTWKIDGSTMETVTGFILGGSKITADGDLDHEIKRHLLLGRKPMTNLDIILKSRDITLPTKVHLVKAIVFPVVMYGHESWT